MNLFNEKIKPVDTDKELKELQEQYKGYDPAYITQSAGIPCEDTKKWFEILWQQYEQYADRDFCEKIKKGFHQRTWEMYLTCTLLNRDFVLEKKKKSEGPDICLVDKSKKIWIEAVTADVGEGDDNAEIHFDENIENIKAIDYPEEQILLRLGNALDNKFRKHEDYLSNNVTKKSEPYIIAVNAGKLLALNPGIPLILKCLFGIGFLTLPIRSKKPRTPYWSRREKLKKKSGSSVSMGFFENAEHSGISAVVYCANDAINCPKDKNSMGDNFVFVLNPLAENMIDENFFSFGQVWKRDNDKVVNMRSQSIRNP